MATFHCKMCGAALQIDSGVTVIECDYCHVKQTLPKLDDDRKINMYDRANHFRRNNEFDKATGIYEQILNEDATDAEAYWSLVLCKYGVEYVDDSVTRKRVPTIHRAQFTSVYDDDNYKMALNYCDTLQRSVFENEAKTINEIQKGFLSISQKETPYDVFICYKETDDNTKERTRDSVLANDLYHQLTQEGFKVFFSRITLEDKLGTAYEPYIFAALNSAKVMVVIGTKREYFDAVWVKNEWSRFLSLIKNGDNKILIPAYKDMDPYDLPEAFSHLQAQDMSKLGFMQDLIHGIKKIAGGSKKSSAYQKGNATKVEGGGNVDSYLKRVNLFLEDGDFRSAREYCEKVLDIEPENALAYLGELMADCYVHNKLEFRDCQKPFDDNNNYKKIMRFGSEDLKTELSGYVDHIKQRNEEIRLSDIYSKARAFKAIGNEIALTQAVELFNSISAYKDSEKLAAECERQIVVVRENQRQAELERARQAELERVERAKREDSLRKESLLQDANLLAKKAFDENSHIYTKECLDAIKLYAQLSGFKDADERRKELIYKRANYLATWREWARSNGQNSCAWYYDTVHYEEAVKLYSSIAGYKDADQRKNQLLAKIEKLKRQKRIMNIIIPLIDIIVVVGDVLLALYWADLEWHNTYYAILWFVLVSSIFPINQFLHDSAALSATSVKYNNSFMIVSMIYWIVRTIYVSVKFSNGEVGHGIVNFIIMALAAGLIMGIVGAISNIIEKKFKKNYLMQRH